jgi:DNA repair protein RecN (Recombination protein N)
MLRNLLIKNYALIEHLEMSPSKELNIITGETGAGKSIMLGAIGLLLGNRADVKVLYDKEEKCIIESSFLIAEYELQSLFAEADIDYEDSCIIRREINPAGKSRSFINDTPVTLEQLRKIGSRLMDVHSQHETLLLGNANFQISIIDAYADNKSLLEKYKLVYREHVQVKEHYKSILVQAEESKKQLDYNNYLLNELLEASLENGEQEQLEKDLKVLENAEDIKSRLHVIVELFSGQEQSILANMAFIEKSAAHLSQYSEDLALLQQRLKSCFLELKDLSYEYEKEEATVESGAENIEKIRERLSMIYSLQKKHAAGSIGELMQLKTALEEKVNFVLDLDENLAKEKEKLDKLYVSLNDLGGKLSSGRKAVFQKVRTELEKLLKEVGMPNASIEIVQAPIEPVANGMDHVSILFSANKGIVPQELKNVASGGEFSRLMLCIKFLLADKTSMPTIVFDEIDTGISGEIAIKVGKMMKQMAQNHQVISISHLPQIAAQGNAHYFVYKDNSREKTSSKIKKLSEEERIIEIAQMIGGARPSVTAISNAKELLSLHG